MGSKVHPPVVAMTAVNMDTESSDESCGTQHDPEAGREQKEEIREVTSIVVSFFLHYHSACDIVHYLLQCILHTCTLYIYIILSSPHQHMDIWHITCVWCCQTNITHIVHCAVHCMSTYM